MTRFQIYLDDPQVEILNYMAAMQNTSRSQIIRDMVTKNTKKIKPKIKNTSPLLKMAGMFKGLPPDLSQRVDEIYHID